MLPNCLFPRPAHQCLRMDDGGESGERGHEAGRRGNVDGQGLRDALTALDVVRQYSAGTPVQDAWSARCY